MDTCCQLWDRSTSSKICVEFYLVMFSLSLDFLFEFVFFHDYFEFSNSCSSKVSRKPCWLGRLMSTELEKFVLPLPGPNCHHEFSALSSILRDKSVSRLSTFATSIRCPISNGLIDLSTDSQRNVRVISSTAATAKTVDILSRSVFFSPIFSFNYSKFCHSFR